MISDQTYLLEHYKRIIEISQQLGSTYDYIELLNKIVNAAKELIQVEAAAILLLDEATGQLRFALSTNIKPYQIENIIVPLEGSIAGWIVMHGEPRVIQDAAADPDHFEGVDETIDFKTHNLLGVPMKAHTRVIGVVQAVNKLGDKRFSDNDIITLRTLAGQAAIAIENARLFQQSDFMAELVHELRTPLQSLKLISASLQKPNIADGKRQEIAEMMSQETERLINLTNDFLDLARLESGRANMDIEPFDLHKLVTETVNMLVPRAQEKGVTIEVPPFEVTATADRGKIKQVLLNLISNAVKYNKSDGRVIITTQPVAENEHPFVQLAVRDTGYGISREHQKNMFQKFYRVPALEGVERGTGLGLTTAKHIVEAHGGRIWLESEEGVGSTFTFVIPREA